MAKDPRYKYIRNDILSGDIKVFKEIFITFPKTNFATDIEVNNKRINKLIEDPNDFKYKEMNKAIQVLGIERNVFCSLLDKQLGTKEKKHKVK
jgi:hypothetical protein